MSEEEISYLKKEVDRQIQIITVLLEQNALLKHENSYLKSGKGLPNVGNSNDKTANRESNVPLSYDKKMVGEGNVPLSNEEIMVGKGNFIHSNDKIMVGQGNVPISYDKIMVGEGNIPLSYEQIMVGKGNVPNSYDKTEVGKSNVVHPLPEILEGHETRHHRIAQNLKRIGLSKVKLEGKLNIAKLFIHFHNKGRGDYATLRKLTGHSEGGLAKLIMSLKKRGLIHRTAYQQFSLSSKATQLLQDTWSAELNGAPINYRPLRKRR